MGDEKNSDLKQTIVNVAWDLFYKQGYENTTISEIIEKANTSKGGFYYHFKAKEELLNSLYTIFDREYEKFYENMDKSLNSLIQLKQINQNVFYFIEQNVSSELLAALYQSQLTQKRLDNFLNPNRYYSKLLAAILTKGQEKDEIRKDISVSELVNHVILLERGIIMDWCIREGNFSLGYFGSQKFDYYVSFMAP